MRLTNRFKVPRSVENYAKEIKRLWAQGATNTLDLARVVCTVRNLLPHGEWTALWQSARMPFSKRKGEMLAAIGERLDWITAQTFAHLPRGWSILYCLAQLERRILEQLIQQGVVQPELRLREAKALLDKFKGKKGRPATLNLRQRVQRFSDFVRSTIWSPEERDWAQGKLRELIRHLDGNDEASFPARDCQATATCTAPVYSSCFRPALQPMEELRTISPEQLQPTL